MQLLAALSKLGILKSHKEGCFLQSPINPEQCLGIKNAKTSLEIAPCPYQDWD